MTLYTIDRVKYSISAREFMEKAESVLGRTSRGGLNFMKRLIKVCYPIISKYKMSFIQ